MSKVIPKLWKTNQTIWKRYHRWICDSLG